MAKDKKVISLAERRRDRSESASASDSTEGSGERGTPVPGRMIWLHCPSCGTLEYTEQAMPGGRVHNTCGTQVEEVAVDVDLRGEYTIAEINLERLDILEQIIDGQRRRYEEYKQRLALAAGGKLEPYPTAEEHLKELPVAEMDALGLLVSHFFRNPAQRFGEGEEEKGEDESPE